MAEPSADHRRRPSDGQPHWRLPFWMLLALIGLAPVACGCGCAAAWMSTLGQVYPRDIDVPTREGD